MKLIPIGSVSESVQLINSSGREASIDASTNALNVMQYEHHEIHGGSHYFVEGHGEFSSGSAVSFAAFMSGTVTAQAHMLFGFKTNGLIEVQMYEGSTETGGAAVTPVNSNRSSANTSKLTIVSNPGLTATGNMLLSFTLGSTGRGASLSFDRENEIVLASNTVYVWHIQAHNANTRISWRGSWYEHSDKT